MIAGISYALAAVVAGVIIWIFAGSGAPRVPLGQTPDAAEVERLHEIRDRVAQVRGLDVATGATEGYLSREALSDYIDEAYSEISDEDRRAFDTQTIVMRMLRMIGPEDDLLAINAATGSLGIAGFYDFEQKSLVVVASNLTGSLNEESTLAHEYTHALQDLRFDLQRYLVSHDIEEAEYAATLPCVFEGDASFAQVKYMEDVYGEDWLLRLIAELSEDTELIELADELQIEIPPAVIRYVYFNYNQCASFAEAIWEEGGWEAVNALYENPPSTTEQVLHPERYIDGEEALPLDLDNIRSDLGLGWRLAYGGAFGEFDVFNYLYSSEVTAPRARSTSEGWGAGKANVYTLGGGDQMKVLLHIALLWDSEEDYEEFRASYVGAISHLGYTDNALGGDVWRFESPGEYGRAIWNKDASRVDLVFGTDESVVDKSESSLTAAD
jgi:hypothetical protein